MKIFIDTAPFIYLIEESPKYAQITRNYIIDIYVAENELVTIVITYAEYCIKPEKEDARHLISAFEELIDTMDIALLPIQIEHAKASYQLRAKYEFLKGMDALQVGVALSEGCSKMLTNDHKLKNIEELQVELLDEKY